jgi:hypothetical protein
MPSNRLGHHRVRSNLAAVAGGSDPSYSLDLGNWDIYLSESTAIDPISIQVSELRPAATRLAKLGT